MFKMQTNHKSVRNLFGHASMSISLVAAGILVLFIAGWGHAAPLGADSAGMAADSFLVKRFPAHDPATARTMTAKGNSPFQVQQVTRLQDNASLLGYVVRLEPQGFLLLSADDQAPPVKLYSEHGSYENLPPAFRAVIEKEMLEDQAALASTAPISRAHLARYKSQWQDLLDAQAPAAPAGDIGIETYGTTILTTTWNQDNPYNYYCPTASGGPGGLAYAGCNATALGQILRHHRQPLAVVGSHSYYDGSGSCTGTHAFSDVGTGAYDWANMPASITTGSPLAQIQAVGRLIYHCAVSLNTDFEASGSSASAENAPEVLRNHFSYTCSDYRWKSSYSSSAWYNLIAADVDLNHPVLYAMWESGYYNGHVVVCDGYRNGNEMHLNLGWGGWADAWYNIDSVSAEGYTWTIHGGVFSIVATNYTLDLARTGSGGVKVNSVLRTLPWSGTFAVGTTVTLEAIPDSGNVLANWSGDLSGNTNPTSIVMNGYKSVTAIFSPPYGSLCVTIGPPGAVTSGASWRRVGTSTWIGGGQTEAVVAVGSYTVEFKDVLGWTKPVSIGVSVSEGVLTTAMATYTMTSQITIGTGTISTWQYPINTNRDDARTQSIYLAGEIGGPRIITALAIDVVTIPDMAMNNFTIRMKPTAKSNYNTSNNFETTGWTTVYQANQTISTTGWKQFNFVTPFNFNYADGNNVMVDISFNNSDWNNPGYCRTTATTYRTIYDLSYSTMGDPLTWSGPATYGNSGIFNIRLNVIPHGDINRDFNVNFADFAIVAAKWRQSSCNAGNQWCAWADVSRSGTVDGADIFELANHWLE
jgi:hypothetical protein